jgi:cytochrome P450
MDLMLSETSTGVRDWRDHASFFLNLSRLCPEEVVPYRAQGQPAFLINRPEHAVHVLSTARERYANPYHPYAELAGLYRPEGSYLLRLGHHADHRSAYVHWLGQLVQSGHELFHGLAEYSRQGPVEVDRAIKQHLLRVFARTLLGVDVTEESGPFIQSVAFVEECQANETFARGEDSELLRLRYAQALEAQQRLVARVLRDSPEVREAVAEEPARHELFSTVIIRTLLNGYNAMATALSWTIHLLGQHPEAQERIREESAALGTKPPTARELPRLRFTRCVIQESLRLYPPAWMLGRRARTEDQIGDVHIPAGAFVSVSPYTLHRHPGAWEDPDAFRPERFEQAGALVPGAYLPFGGGLRSCPAEHSVVGPLQLLISTLVREHRLQPVPGLAVRPRGLVSLRPSPGIQLQLLPV